MPGSMVYPKRTPLERQSLSCSRGTDRLCTEGESRERKNMKKNTIKHSPFITKWKKQFFALMLGVILAILPMTRVMAFDVNIDNENYSFLGGLQGLVLRPGEDRIVWEMSAVNSGKLRVVYKNTDGTAWDTYDSGVINPGSLSNQRFEYTIESSSINNFDHWRVAYPPTQSNEGECSVICFTLAPVLTTDGYTVTVTAEPAGAGHPTSLKNRVFPGEDDYAATDIMANPGEGYEFVRWEALEGADIIDPSAEDTLFRYLGAGEVNIKAVYQKKTNSSDKDDDDSGSSGKTHKRHVHDYEWLMIKEATPYENGEYVYRCKECGHVADRAGADGTVVLMNAMKSAIETAPENGTVRLDCGYYMSLNEAVAKAHDLRPDVTVIFTFLDKGVRKELVIPAGTQFVPMLNEYGWVGFRCIATHTAEGVTLTEIK